MSIYVPLFPFCIFLRYTSWQKEKGISLSLYIYIIYFYFYPKLCTRAVVANEATTSTPTAETRQTNKQKKILI
jgi:hypothetical protein